MNSREHLEAALSGILLTLEEPIDSIAVFSLLIDLIEWCDRHKVDLDAELSNARQHIAECGL